MRIIITSTIVLATSLFCTGLSAQNNTSGQISANYDRNMTSVMKVRGTETHYMRVGITQFEKGNYAKSKRAFEAVLRAKPDNARARIYLEIVNKKLSES